MSTGSSGDGGVNRLWAALAVKGVVLRATLGAKGQIEPLDDEMDGNLPAPRPVAVAPKDPRQLPLPLPRRGQR